MTLGQHTIPLALRGNIDSLPPAGTAQAAADAPVAVVPDIQFSRSISKRGRSAMQLWLGVTLADSLYAAAAACAPQGVDVDSLQLELTCHKPSGGGGSDNDSTDGGGGGGAGAAGSSETSCGGGVVFGVCDGEGTRLRHQPKAAQLLELMPGAKKRSKKRQMEEQAAAEAAAATLPGIGRTRGDKASRQGG